MYNRGRKWNRIKFNYFRTRRKEIVEMKSSDKMVDLCMYIVMTLNINGQNCPIKTLALLG